MAATAGYRPASGPWRISSAWKCLSDLFDAALRSGGWSTCIRQWRQVAGAHGRLQLDIRAEALRGELASDARLFETTERAGDVDVVHVDAEGARANRFGDLQAVGGVGGPDRSGQAVLAVVGDANRVALVGILQHRQHRTEDLLAGDAHLVGGVGEQRWPDIPTAVVRAVVAADDDACALVEAGADVALHAVLLALGAKGTDVGGLIGRITDLQARHHLRERVDHFVVAAFTNQDPGLQHTPLPVVHQPRCLQSRDGAVDVRIIENDRCGLAAQLQTHPLELLTADLSNPPPASGGAGKRNLVHPRI